MELATRQHNVWWSTAVVAHRALKPGLQHVLRRKTCYDRLSVFQLYLVQLSSEREASLVHVLAFEQARRSAALWSIACAAKPARLAACRRIILVQSNASQRARQLLTRQCRSARSRARPRHRSVHRVLQYWEAVAIIAQTSVWSATRQSTHVYILFWWRTTRSQPRPKKAGSTSRRASSRQRRTSHLKRHEHHRNHQHRMPPRLRGSSRRATLGCSLHGGKRKADATLRKPTRTQTVRYARLAYVLSDVQAHAVFAWSGAARRSACQQPTAASSTQSKASAHLYRPQEPNTCERMAAWPSMIVCRQLRAAT